MKQALVIKGRFYCCFGTGSRCSTAGLDVPDIDSDMGLMLTLFTLEDIYGLKIKELDGEVCLHLGKGMGANYITMFEMFTAWKEQAENLKNGEISKEKYDN